MDKRERPRSAGPFHVRFEVMRLRLAGLVELYSKNSTIALSAEGLRALSAPSSLERPAFKARSRVEHSLTKRLDVSARQDIIRRYQAGESATSIARDYDVAPSALLNLLRAECVVVRQRTVTAEQAERMKQEYESGTTVAALSDRHRLSRGAVLRTLHRVGAAMRPVGRKPHQSH